MALKYMKICPIPLKINVNENNTGIIPNFSNYQIFKKLTAFCSEMGASIYW